MLSMSRMKELFSVRYEGWPPEGTRCAWMGNTVMFKGVVTGPVEAVDASSGNMTIIGVCEEFNVTKCKRGKSQGEKMAFTKISDSLGLLDNIVIFPDTFKKCFAVQTPKSGDILLVSGFKKDDSFIVQQIEEL